MQQVIDALRARVAEMERENLDLVGGMTQLSADVAYYHGETERLSRVSSRMRDALASCPPPGDRDFRRWYEVNRREALAP